VSTSPPPALPVTVLGLRSDGKALVIELIVPASDCRRRLRTNRIRSRAGPLPDAPATIAVVRGVVMRGGRGGGAGFLAAVFGGAGFGASAGWALGRLRCFNGLAASRHWCRQARLDVHLRCFGGLGASTGFGVRRLWRRLVSAPSRARRLAGAAPLRSTRRDVAIAFEIGDARLRFRNACLGVSFLEGVHAICVPPFRRRHQLAPSVLESLSTSLAPRSSRGGETAGLPLPGGCLVDSPRAGMDARRRGLAVGFQLATWVRTRLAFSEILPLLGGGNAQDLAALSRFMLLSMNALVPRYSAASSVPCSLRRAS